MSIHPPPMNWRAFSLRVDGGQFFRGSVMIVEHKELNVFVLTFEPKELEYLRCEAGLCWLTVSAMIEQLFGVLFVGGYKVLTGKES